MKKSMWTLFTVALALTLTTSTARADDGEDDEGGDSPFSLALTLGEGMIFLDHDVYRSPVSLEVVPSLGWSWFKFDFGLYTTFEDLRIADSSVGFWTFAFRPGARLTPPIIPLYVRAALPLQLQAHDFDWGVLFGVGLDIHIVSILGIVFEVDTLLTKNLEWGGVGVPLEFRGGVSLSF